MSYNVFKTGNINNNNVNPKPTQTKNVEKEEPKNPNPFDLKNSKDDSFELKSQTICDDISKLKQYEKEMNEIDTALKDCIEKDSPKLKLDNNN